MDKNKEALTKDYIKGIIKIGSTENKKDCSNNVETVLSIRSEDGN